MKNNAKTLVLLATLSGLMVGIGSIFGGRAGATMALVFAGLMNFVAYWFSDKIALKMSGAKPLSEVEAPRLHSMVASLAQVAQIPVPRLYLIPSAQPNAFATGRNPAHAAVAVTQGLLDQLDLTEVEGVIAHELAHVRHRDILIASVAATVAGAISWIASMARWGAIVGDDDDAPGGILGLLLATLVAPIAALIIQMAISRSREFHADAAGARISGRPESLASALQKIETMSRQVPMPVNPAVSPLFIANPLGAGLGRSAIRMFMTHPPTEERIARLMNMVGRV